jgi:glycosyltransferase involved in cell wall biosynthesis
MQITFLMPADNLTGGCRVVATYAKILQSRGHTVHIVGGPPIRPTWRERLRAWRRGQMQALRQRQHPPPGHLTLSGVPYSVLERPRPIKAADVPNADVVIATWWETAVWMAALPERKGKKVHLIQGYEIWGGDKTRERVHAALRLPNRKIAISAGLKHDIEAVLGNLDIAVVPNAVDLRQFDAPPRQRGEPPTVGFIYAANSPFKGVDRAVKIIERARRDMPELRVLAFGAHQPTPELPLPPNTAYTQRPLQSQLASLYASCDAWLFTSRLDSFGLPILEAMACRTPVIGVPIGAAPDLLADGNGILVIPSSEEALPEEFAAAVLRLCRMPAEEWAAMSERAYRRAHGYTWEDAADRLEALISAAVATPK